MHFHESFELKKALNICWKFLTLFQCLTIKLFIENIKNNRRTRYGNNPYFLLLLAEESLAMTPRKHDRADWKSWSFNSVTSFLDKCMFLLYAFTCVWLSGMLREALPGRWSDIFLVIVLSYGVPYREKIWPLIRGLLRFIATESNSERAIK
jgi:hypothetical protein